MTAQTLIQQVTDTLYAPVRYTGAGSPEGVVTAGVGWMYRDTNNGVLWYKKTGTDNTGWKSTPSVISLDTTTTGNVGTGEDTLQSYTLPAGILKDDGDAIRITLHCTGAANLNTKEVKIKFGSTTVFTTTALSNPSTLRLVASVLIVRTGAATQKTCSAWNATIVGTNTGAAVTATASETLSGAVTILVTGEATADNDILKQIFQVELLPAP